MNPSAAAVAIEEWAIERNLIKGSDSKTQFAKLMSECGELADAILKNDLPNIIDGIGDAVVVLTIIAAQNGISLGQCMSAAYDEIKDRKGVMYNGTFIKESDARYPHALIALSHDSMAIDMRLPE